MWEKLREFHPDLTAYELHEHVRYVSYYSDVTSGLFRRDYPITPFDRLKHFAVANVFVQPGNSLAQKVTCRS